MDLGKRVQAAFENAAPEQRKQMSTALSSPHVDNEESMSMEDVQRMVEQPIQSSLSANVVTAAPFLREMRFLILEVTGSDYFITSDNPCIWFDPASYQDPRPIGAGGLISPTMEITLPLSPRHMVFYGNELLASGVYMPIDHLMIQNLNKRTRLFADQYFISNGSTLNPKWF